MIEIDLEQLVPRFLLEDRNGAALAAAIKTGMERFCQTIQRGMEITLDVEKMPGWRLDEMAWELGCLYDYNAAEENKRTWIRDAIPLYASFGTVEAVYKYLGGYFDGVEVEENWRYRGEPYHFRVTVSGEWTDKKERWAKKAVEATKNVRSVLDDISIGGYAAIAVSAHCAFWRFPYEMTESGRLAGFFPLEAFSGKIWEEQITIRNEEKAAKIQYTMAGTTPLENMAGAIRTAAMRAESEGKEYRIIYEMPGQEEKTGTIPQENTVAGGAGGAATALAYGKGTVFSYPQTGEMTLCGENEP